MKELDKTKAYDLRDLNNEQRTELLEWLKVNDKGWEYINESELFEAILYYENSIVEWNFEYIDERKLGYRAINALTLFEPQLKIGDTFEHEGFICEVKEPIKKWYYNTRIKAYSKTTHYCEYLKEITDQEFIKQLEKHAR